MDAAPQPGRVFDHYRVLEKLGEGGMGAVWLAEDTRLGRKVALKFLPLEAAKDPVRRQRFELEARSAAALSHPGIATVHELAEFEGQTSIVFEYVPGASLRSRVVHGGLSRDELLEIAGDIADALAAAHAAGVVHRDLKPENVMRTPSGDCKVLDFGLARINVAAKSEVDAETRTNLTSAGMVLGTVGYMAPEQLEGKEVDFRCDIFAFGTLLYELATGIHPFQGGSSASTIAAIMNAEPPPLTQRNTVHPPELERIVRKCQRKRREERYQSTSDLAVDLKTLKRESGERSSAAMEATSFAASAVETSFFQGLHRLFPTLRRIWELMVLLSFAALPAVAILAWFVRRASVIQSGPVNVWFLAVMLNTAILSYLRFSVILRAAVNPAKLPERVAGFAPAIQLFTASYGVLAILAAPLLEMDRYPAAAPFAIVLGFAALLYAFLVEPRNNRTTFPQAFEPAAQPAPTASRAWWWLHQLSTMFASTPLAVFLMLEAREALLATVGQQLFLLESIILGMHWSVRFALISAAIGSPATLEQQVVRMRPWIQWTGWPVVTGLAAAALFATGAKDFLAAILGSFAMGGVVCLLFLDPAVERAAFPHLSDIPAAHSSFRWNVRTWWWVHNIFACVVASPLVAYLAWLALQSAKVAWGSAAFIAVIASIGLGVGARITLMFFAGFAMPDFSAQLKKLSIWQRVATLIAAIAVALLAAVISDAHVWLAAFLASLAVTGLVGSEVVEPVIARAAFPEESPKVD
ncbi:MAG: serine/threonine protein kinase [Acidobacteria bacterium]|nr:serine/threonine protein kinase [Acidobacteriota bacterium]